MISRAGLYPELSETYHTVQHTPTLALTQSRIKVLLNETPFDMINAQERKSDEMDFGSIVHALALGKGARFSIAPYDDYRTKEAREWKAEQVANGVIPIKADKYAEAEEIAGIIRYAIERTLKGEPYQTEVPFFWQEGDVWCQGCLDIWCPSLLVALDPKITRNVGKRAQSHIVNMGWDYQAAWYRRGLEAIMPEHAGRIRFANILIKPDAPFTSRTVMLNEAWRDSAERECLRALAIFERCQKENRWPGYSEDIEMLDVPAWALHERMMAEMEE